MATVDYFSADWVAIDGDGIFPGEAHNWWATAGFIKYGAVVSVTAYAVTGDPNDQSRQLEVRSLRTEGHPDGGRTILFTVINVGPSPIPAYAVGISAINP